MKHLPLHHFLHPKSLLRIVPVLNGEDCDLLGELPCHLKSLPVVTHGLFVIISFRNLLRENYSLKKKISRRDEG